MWLSSNFRNYKFCLVIQYFLDWFECDCTQLGVPFSKCTEAFKRILVKLCTYLSVLFLLWIMILMNIFIDMIIRKIATKMNNHAHTVLVFLTFNLCQPMHLILEMWNFLRTHNVVMLCQERACLWFDEVFQLGVDHLVGLLVNAWKVHLGCNLKINLYFAKCFC